MKFCSTNLLEFVIIRTAVKVIEWVVMRTKLEFPIKMMRDSKCENGWIWINKADCEWKNRLRTKKTTQSYIRLNLWFWWNVLDLINSTVYSVLFTFDKCFEYFRQVALYTAQVTVCSVPMVYCKINQTCARLIFDRFTKAERINKKKSRKIHTHTNMNSNYYLMHLKTNKKTEKQEHTRR